MPALLRWILTSVWHFVRANKIETGFLCGHGARVIVFYARVVQQLGFWTQKVQANVVYCYVRRRAEYTSLGPGLEHLSPVSYTHLTLPTTPYV